MKNKYRYDGKYILCLKKHENFNFEMYHIHKLIIYNYALNKFRNMLLKILVCAPKNDPLYAVYTLINNKLALK